MRMTRYERERTSSNTYCQEIVARNADPQLRREGFMKCDEIVAKLVETIGIQAHRQRPGRSVAGRESGPRRVRAGLAIERRGALEAEIERVAEQFADALDAAPLERGMRCRCRRRRHVA